MSKSYPMWISNYNNTYSMPSSKSSGVRERSVDNIHIGTSKSNSHPFITRALWVDRKENGDIVYTAGVDLKPEGCAGSIILRQCTLVKETGEIVYDTYPPFK